MVFVADDLAAWLTGVLADAGRKKLVTLVRGTEQERSLRQAATAAVQRTAAELRPNDKAQAAELVRVVGEVFREPAPRAPLADDATLLGALDAGIAAQLAALGDVSLTGTGRSSADVLGVSVAVVASTLSRHLLREIVTRGAEGGPLFPLASQLNDDVTHLQGQRLEGMLGEVLTRLVRLEVTRAGTAPSALVQLPPLAAGFSGRDDELVVLADLLNPQGSHGPVLVSAVAGLAGVGKTSLAVAAGHAAVRQGWFGGGVLFVDLHGYDETPVQAGQALDALLRALGVPAERIPLTTDERSALYRSVLGQTAGPVLVVADNASSEAQVRPLLPGGGPHKVLVTSRHTLAGLGARLVDVTILDQDAAVALLDAALRAARPRDDRITGDRQAAARLAGACGGLPLALQITAAQLTADPALTAAELADELAAESRRLERLAYDGCGTSAPSVAAAFELSYRRLDGTAGRVFRLLPINPGPDISTAAAAALTGLPVKQARTLLADLARAHLVEAAPGAAGRWRMHDLVRLYARQVSDEHAEGDGREQARDRLLGYYLDTAATAGVHLQPSPKMAVPDAFTGREDALAWLDGERASLVTAPAMAAAAGRDQAALRLPLSLAVYLDWRRRFDDLLAVTMISLSAARRLGDRRHEGDALNSLGNALAELRRFDEAITACQDAAAVYRETGDRQREANALTSLGNALKSVRRFDEAITVHHDAAIIYRETGNRYGEGNALNNLGVVLLEMRRFDEAITACQGAAAIYRQTGDRHREGMALGNLGAALHQVGRLREAITTFQNAAAIYRQFRDRHREGNALSNLGSALRQVGRLDDAITACHDAAAILRETGDRHREGMALINLGAVLVEMRRFDEAITACQDAAAIFRETADRYREGNALNNLSLVLLGMRRFDEAITACQDAAAIYRQTGDRYKEHIALRILDTARTAQRAGT